MDESEEVDGAAIVSCGDAAEMFELVEAALDSVSRLVGGGIVRDRCLAIAFGGDDGGHAGVGDEAAQGIVVIGFVGDDAGCRVTVEECGGCHAVMNLACREDDAKRPAEGIGKHVNFGG